MPGFSAICLPAAQASWFALPVTKLLKLKFLFKPVVFIILSGFFTLSFTYYMNLLVIEVR